MSYRLLILILRSRFRLILFTLLVTVATAATITSFQSNLYIAETSLVLSFQSDDPFDQKAVPVQLSASYLATQLDILRSRKVALRVVDILRLEEDPAIKESFQLANSDGLILRDWVADALMSSFVVEPLRDSRVINLGFESGNPDRAAQIVNAFAQAYIDTTLELTMEPASRSADWFDSQLKVLRLRVEQAQAKLTDFQQVNGIVALDDRLDIETSRLNEMSKNLVAAQGETANARSRQLGENHPELKRAIQREQSSKAALEKQKAQILELKKQRDAADSLAREVEVEQQNYKATLESYYQTRLKSQFNETDIAILSPAIPPQSPSSPNVVLNLLSAVFLGLSLGVVLAIVLEMTNRRLRSDEDVTEFLNTEVLATV
jgi:uncharacterized protein involved in exopolysaccharide biosynthesis